MELEECSLTNIWSLPGRKSLNSCYFPKKFDIHLQKPSKESGLLVPRKKKFITFILLNFEFFSSGRRFP